MKLSKKIIGLAAATALVAGAGAMAAAPATAKVNYKKSATIISFKKDLITALETQGIQVSVAGDATWNSKKAQVRFPVTKVTDDAISHSGTLVFTKGETIINIENPTVVTPTPVPETGLPVTATTALGVVPVMNLKHAKFKENCSVNKNKKTKKFTKTNTTRIQTDVHLTSDPNVIGALQALLGPAFTADLGLGQSRTTLIDQATSKKKKKC